MFCAAAMAFVALIPAACKQPAPESSGMGSDAGVSISDSQNEPARSGEAALSPAAAAVLRGPGLGPEAPTVPFLTVGRGKPDDSDQH